MLSVFLAAYGIVFLTELIGDKTLLTIGALATRLRPLPLFGGISAAFMLKMLAAVLLGRVIAVLPGGLVTAVSAGTFLAIALAIWFKKPEDKPAEPRAIHHWSKAMLTGFAAIFFSEWGDVGQITAATLVARYHVAFIVWLGATLGLVTKGILAMTLGVGLRRWIPERALRYGAIGLCLTMGILSAFRISF